MAEDTVRGMYCLRCSSRRVVRGKLGEAARFYPLRSMLKSMLAKPVFLSQEHSHACLDCGLAWNEVDKDELRKNLKKWGMVRHSTVVMEAVQEGKLRATGGKAPGKIPVKPPVAQAPPSPRPARTRPEASPGADKRS